MEMEVGGKRFGGSIGCKVIDDYTDNKEDEKGEKGGAMREGKWSGMFFEGFKGF